ncbi:MAG: N-acetyltransferase [Thermodesulfovibrio sp.]|nr:N-acetyltransferase [Thermodesulfovibrio sp.]
MTNQSPLEPRIIGKSSVGTDTLLAWDVVIGHPSKATLLVHRDFFVSAGATVGDRCILRSGTVVYEDVTLGNNVQTGHHVVIREEASVGDDCVFGNGTEIQIGAKFGRNVRLQACVMVSEGASFGNDIFVGQGVVFTAGRVMTGALQAAGRLSGEQAALLEGRCWEGASVIVEDDVRIGANSVILAGVRLGKGSVIAAGAVVSNDVPPGMLAAGNPARILKRVVPLDGNVHG